MASQHRVPVILTRPLEQAERFARSLPAAALPVVSPLLRIMARETDVDFAVYDGFLFTSENAVRAINGSVIADGRIAYCVGDRTADAARRAGFSARSAKGTAEDLVAMVAEMAPSGRLLHVHGAHARGDVAAQLESIGITADGAVVYDQLAQRLSDKAKWILFRQRSIVPLFSPRTALLFVEDCPNAPLAELVCLSSTVVDTLADGRYADVVTAKAPNAAAMLDEISCRVTG